MLVNYFCGVADKLKSLARQAQVTDPADSSHWLGRLKPLARQAQSAGPTGSRRWPVGSKRSPGKLKALTRLAQSAHPAGSKRPAPQSQPPALSFPRPLVLQVPNILRLVVDRDRLNLGVV